MLRYIIVPLFALILSSSLMAANFTIREEGDHVKVSASRRTDMALFVEVCMDTSWAPRIREGHEDLAQFESSYDAYRKRVLVRNSDGFFVTKVKKSFWKRFGQRIRNTLRSYNRSIDYNSVPRSLKDQYSPETYYYYNQTPNVGGS